jgi:hypothetical protein
MSNGNHETIYFTVGNSYNHGNQVGLNCLCIITTTLFVVGNCGNQGVYCRAETTYRHVWLQVKRICGYLLNRLVDFLDFGREVTSLKGTFM